MTATVRSVRAVFEAEVAKYIADVKMAGRETRNAFDSANTSVTQTGKNFEALSKSERVVEQDMKRVSEQSRRTSREVDGLGKSTRKTREDVDGLGDSLGGTTRKTKEFTLESAIAAERASRLRQELREQAKAALDAEAALQVQAERVDDTGRSFRRVGNEIDTMSGRAHLLLDALVLLGPAIAPIGALAVPALAGLSGEFGASALAAGGAVIAFQGVGDALKALDKARLQPTAENMQLAREAVEDLAPAAQRLVGRLTGLRDEWIKTRNITAQGLFPGVNFAMDDLEKQLPRVQGFLFDITRETGRLIREGADDLTSGHWQAFFTYLDQYARPLLDDTAYAIGNIGHGLGELFAATAPMQLGFSHWLMDVTESFDRWASRLSQTQGFEDFMAYVAETGPKVAHAAGALADAIIQIVEAAAPLGGPTLDAITAVATAIGDIADSDFGTPLLATASGLIAIARAKKLLTAAGGNDFIATGYVKPLKELPKTIPSLAQVGTVMYRAGQSSKYATEETIKARKAVGEFGKSLAPVGKGAAVLGGLAVASTGVADSFGLSNTASLALMGTIAGPWGTAIGAGAGALMDLKTAADNSTAAVKTLDDAIFSGDRMAIYEAIAGANDKLNNLSWFDNLIGTGDQLEASLKSAYVELEALDGAAGHTGDVADLLGETIGLTGDKFRLAAGDVAAMSTQLGILNGWLDKRDAFRNYQQSLDDFTKSLKENGHSFDINKQKGRDNQAALDGIARSITQVASKMKSPALRQNFIRGAIRDLREMSQDAAPSTQRALRQVIAQVRRFDTAPPAKAKLGADTSKADAAVAAATRKMRRFNREKGVGTLDLNRHPAESGFGWLYGQMGKANRSVAVPKVRVDAGNSASVIGGVQARLNMLRDRTIHITTIANKIAAGSAGTNLGGQADGGTVPGPRAPYGDKIVAMLAPGEEIITNRHGEADRYRADRAAGRIPAYADGGTAGGGRGYRNPDRLDGSDIADLTVRQLRHLGNTLDDLSDKRLKKLGKSLDKASDIVDRRVDAARNRRDDLVSRSNELRSTVAGALNHDPFGNGLAGFDTQVAADKNDANAMERALRAAEARGLSGSLLAALASSGDVNTAQQFAHLSRAQIAQRERQFAGANAARNAVGSFVANNQFGPQIAESNRVLSELTREQRELRLVVRDLKHEVREGARQGTRDGMEKKDRDTHQRSRR